MATWLAASLFVIAIWVIPMVIYGIKNQMFTRKLDKFEKQMLTFWGAFYIFVETIILIITL